MAKTILVGEKQELPLKTVSLEQLIEEKIAQIGSYLWDNTNRYIHLGELQNNINLPLNSDEYEEILGILKKYSGEIFEDAEFTSRNEFYWLKETYGKKYPHYPPEIDKSITKRIFEK
jgi:hypothetical protein